MLCYVISKPKALFDHTVQGTLRVRLRFRSSDLQSGGYYLREKMLLAFRISCCATRRFPTRLKTSSVVLSASALSHGNQLCARLSSNGPKSAATNEVKREADTLPKNQFSSVRPLPTPPRALKGTLPTISTHDIEKYVQPLYSRGWGLSPILPNGNGIAVLRKRFEFWSAEALEGFLADLSKYEEKKQVRFFFPFRSAHPVSDSQFPNFIHF
jgi:hypothetical protein